MQKKYKIACLGCSWTEGAGPEQLLPYTETYPYILNDWLKELGVEIQHMVNAGRSGSGVAFYPFTANYLLKEFDPDIFVLQITTHDRDIFPIDPIEDDRKEMNFGWDKEENNYYKVWDNNVNVIHLSPGFGASVSKHSKENRWESIVKNIWERKVLWKVSPELSYDNFKNYIATWWEQSKDTRYQKYYWYQQTYALIDQLEALGKKVIPFYWINHKPKLKTDLFPVRQYPSVENLFDDKTFKSLQIDDGYHFGKQGNTKLVQEFLGPKVLEIMK
jgi:hypothetical protein